MSYIFVRYAVLIAQCSAYGIALSLESRSFARQVLIEMDEKMQLETDAFF